MEFQMTQETRINHTAQARAYHFLKNEICAGRLSASEMVDAQSISKQLQMSRVPVREAIFQLIAEGFLSVLPNRRVIVTQLGPDKIEEIFEMRAVLEGLAARRASYYVNAETIVNLRFILQRMRLAERQPDVWVQLHAEFHSVLCTLAGYPSLLAEIQRLHSMIQPYLRLYYTAYERLEMKTAEHQILVDALQSGDGALIEAKMRDHISTAGRELANYSRELGVKRA
ncbi:MAG: GntR family transcriptional regulator [Mesorhizobium sp.]|uniref:GntR family transcriptional regulator n=1 Tax=Mesorhizobium sp. TaxID=1871066 RepID=UPI001AD2C7FC|nr:GntR family transcriptional regulator [Mesorhizobium sp.]MBN9221803.1 GntR family transcriptional regulator [Mesorhizobium sp.]